MRIFKGHWDIKDVIKSNEIFVYGDNNLRYGKGGQAVIRDLKNTIGIRTKKEPKKNLDSFYTDLEYEDNIMRISEDIKKIVSLRESGHSIVFSDGGYGIGLAKLQIYAPRTLEFLNKQLLENFGYINSEKSYLNNEK